MIDGQLRMVSRGLMTAGAVMQGARGGAILPTSQIARVKSHLARYYRKTGEEAPRKRD